MREVPRDDPAERRTLLRFLFPRKRAMPVNAEIELVLRTFAAIQRSSPSRWRGSNVVRSAVWLFAMVVRRIAHAMSP
jgi:hypothetical protein